MHHDENRCEKGDWGAQGTVPAPKRAENTEEKNLHCGKSQVTHTCVDIWKTLPQADFKSISVFSEATEKEQLARSCISFPKLLIAHTVSRQNTHTGLWSNLHVRWIHVQHTFYIFVFLLGLSFITTLPRTRQQLEFASPFSPTRLATRTNPHCGAKCAIKCGISTVPINSPESLTPSP